MRYLVNMTGASLTNAEILKKSTDDAQISLQLGASPDAFDAHDDTVINTALWAANGSGNTEGAFLGTNCIKIAGPTSPAWDTDGVVYKPAITPTVGTAIMGQAILSDGGRFAIGLQEYSYTVDDVAAPTTWTLKYDTVQTTDNSTYLVFEAGRIVVYRGGSAGQQIVVDDTAWTVSETGKVRPIYYAFVFASNGYQIYVNQPTVWDAPKLIHTEVRSNNQHPTDGYSFCVNKYFPDSTLGFYGLCTAFKSDATASMYIVVDSTSTSLKASTLGLNESIGGILSQNGSVAVQFPKVSPKWYTLTELAASSLELTGYIGHTMTIKLTGDATVAHPVTINTELES